ncbi:peptidoglycan-binding protein [Pseudonocardia acaciae]|uniref:peptidoglycan-binding protein n=1 Tax=Pseudonocardia acaciae TaxID=551276 RepID=UPI000688EA7C|nr:peptidoglycan-binding protein [Pseudonocardia acaciae]
MAINLYDYAHTAADRGWGSGWPRCSGGSDLATVTADRSGTRVSVRKGLSVLVDTLLDWTERPDGGNYLLKPGQCGGYNCRPIAGTRTPSNHSWAVAVDLNWNDNPYTSTGRHTIPTQVAAVWKHYGFAWGGDYKGARKDWMHFEFMGTPADAVEKSRLALTHLAAPGGAQPSPPAGGALARGSSGPVVAAMQARLNRDYPAYSTLTVDGAFGAATEAVVREFQRRAGLAEDGVAGPATLAALHLA